MSECSSCFWSVKHQFRKGNAYAVNVIFSVHPNIVAFNFNSSHIKLYR